MTTTKCGTLPMRVMGGFITQCIRMSKTPFEDMAKAGTTLTAPQIQAILDNRARIEGDNVDGYEYVEER